MSLPLRAIAFSIGLSLVISIFMPVSSNAFDGIVRAVALIVGLYVTGLAIFSKTAEPGKGSEG